MERLDVASVNIPGQNWTISSTMPQICSKVNGVFKWWAIRECRDKLMNDAPLESEDLNLRLNAERVRTRLEAAAVNWVGNHCTCNATYIVGWYGLKQIPNAVALRWITALPCNICDNQATLSLPSRGNTTLWLHRWKRNQHANFNLHAWKTSQQNYPNQLCRNYG